MGMLIINIGDSQPVKCDKCESYEGYQIADRLKTHYHRIYGNDGDMEGGFYSDYQPIIYKCVRPECPNCGTLLNFKIKRD